MSTCRRALRMHQNNCVSVRQKFMSGHTKNVSSHTKNCFLHLAHYKSQITNLRLLHTNTNEMWERSITIMRSVARTPDLLNSAKLHKVCCPLPSSVVPSVVMPPVAVVVPPVALVVPPVTLLPLAVVQPPVAIIVPRRRAAHRLLCSLAANRRNWTLPRHSGVAHDVYME